MTSSKGAQRERMEGWLRMVSNSGPRWAGVVEKKRQAHPGDLRGLYDSVRRAVQTAKEGETQKRDGSSRSKTWAPTRRKSISSEEVFQAPSNAKSEDGRAPKRRAKDRDPANKKRESQPGKQDNDLKSSKKESSELIRTKESRPDQRDDEREKTHIIKSEESKKVKKGAGKEAAPWLKTPIKQVEIDEQVKKQLAKEKSPVAVVKARREVDMRTTSAFPEAGIQTDSTSVGPSMPHILSYQLPTDIGQLPAGLLEVAQVLGSTDPPNASAPTVTPQTVASVPAARPTMNKSAQHFSEYLNPDLNPYEPQALEVKDPMTVEKQTFVSGGPEEVVPMQGNGVRAQPTVSSSMNGTSAHDQTSARGQFASIPDWDVAFAYIELNPQIRNHLRQQGYHTISDFYRRRIRRRDIGPIVEAIARAINETPLEWALTVKRLEEAYEETLYNLGVVISGAPM